MQVGKTFAQRRARLHRQFERAVAARQPQPRAMGEGDVVDPLRRQCLTRLHHQFPQSLAEILAQWL